MFTVRRNTPARTSGIKLFALFVFTLTAIPKINVKIGPVPLYFIDILVVLLVYVSLRSPSFNSGRRPFKSIVMALFLFAIGGEIASYVYSGAVLQPAYLATRTTLAFLVYFIAGQLVRGPGDLELVLKAAALGLMVTALLMILTSLPMTRSFVVGNIFSNAFLDPASEGIVRKFDALLDTGQRGRTLVGVSIMGATFVNVCWPLAAILGTWHRPIGIWRRVARTACLLAPMAVLMSYSRGPILGSIMIMALVLLFRFHGLRRGIVVPVILGAMLILSIGTGSRLFFFDRLINRTAAALESPFSDVRESERTLSYIEPFRHVMDNPRFLILGEGNAIAKTYATPERADKATHSLFAMAYYTNGMVAAFLYMILLMNMVYYAYWHVTHQQSTVGAGYAQAIFVSVIALIPWAAFGHAIVSTPRGAMMFFLIAGLLTSLRHFQPLKLSLSNRELSHVDSRRIAV